MARSVWVAAVSFVLIAALSLFCDGACRRTSDELQRGCHEAEERIRSGQKTEALRLLNGMESEWEQRADYFSFFVDHQQTERIEENLRNACIALEHGMEYEAFSSLALLKEAAESLYEAQAFVLKNIW